MFIGDKGKPNKYSTMRLNYDILIDNEKFSLSKMTRELGFYTILFDGKIKDVETVYDTDKKLLTGAGIIIRKKTTPKRTYFSLVRVSSMSNIQNREKKSFLGECEINDQPSDFPTQIADEIDKIFNGVFTINLVDIVKHSTPYIRIDILGNRYKIVSGTGYEAEMSFEILKIRDVRTGRKAKKRIFSLKLELDPNYEKEREHILHVIDRYCKELVPIDRNRFEIAEVEVRERIPQIKEGENQPQKEKKKKNKKKNNEEM